MNEAKLNHNIGLILVGVLLILAGFVLTVSLFSYIGAFINNPEDIGMVKAFISDTDAPTRLFYGTYGGQPIDINVDPRVMLGFYLLLGIMLISAIGGIIKAFIQSGITALNGGMVRQPKPVKLTRQHQDVSIKDKPSTHNI